MKKYLSVLLAVLMIFTLVGCSDDKSESDTYKVGIVLIGDELDGYSKAHMDGIEKAAVACNAEVIYKKNAGDGDQTTADKLEELIEEGCSVLITNSYGHQSYCAQVAGDYEDLTFVAMTGDNMAASGLNNLSNCFNRIYEARYVAGIAAGMKLNELEAAGKLSAENYVSEADNIAADQIGNIKIGYVSAFAYAECISGYTAYYLGVKSVCDHVTMLVNFSNDWSDFDLENKCAKQLISKGCVVISQHADTTGAATAVEAAHAEDGKEVYIVGYNISMLEAAPTSALTSATNDWSVDYTYIIKGAQNGEKLIDYSAGYAEGAVGTTELGSACAAGTAEKMQEAVDAIKSGNLKVFDLSKMSVNNAPITSNQQCVDSWFATEENCIADGYFHESQFRSAPYFSAAIDGIVTLSNVG